jgi:hypothetical protein
MERRQIWSRPELSQFPVFQKLSSDPGRFDRSALSQAMAEDPEMVLDLLPHLAKASDGVLRRIARQVAGRLVVRFAEEAAGSATGDGKWRAGTFTPGAELDIESALEEVLIARTLGLPLDVEDLRARSWQRRPTAVCLVVDTSGSMGADRLSAAAVATAALALRAPADFSVVAVSDKALILKAQGSTRPADAVVDDLFGLRSYGWTDLSLGLRAARAQLARSTATRKLTLLLTDGQANRGADPAVEAARLDTVHVIVPGAVNAACAEIARAGRGRVAVVTSLADTPGAINALLRA